jgi:hypothetical protein
MGSSRQASIPVPLSHCYCLTITRLGIRLSVLGHFVQRAIFTQLTTSFLSRKTPLAVLNIYTTDARHLNLPYLGHLFFCSIVPHINNRFLQALKPVNSGPRVHFFSHKELPQSQKRGLFHTINFKPLQICSGHFSSPFDISFTQSLPTRRKTAALATNSEVDAVFRRQSTPLPKGC